MPKSPGIVFLIKLSYLFLRRCLIPGRFTAVPNFIRLSVTVNGNLKFCPLLNYCLTLHSSSTLGRQFPYPFLNLQQFLFCAAFSAQNRFAAVALTFWWLPFLVEVRMNLGFYFGGCMYFIFLEWTNEINSLIWFYTIKKIICYTLLFKALPSYHIKFHS